MSHLDKTNLAISPIQAAHLRAAMKTAELYNHLIDVCLGQNTSGPGEISTSHMGQMFKTGYAKFQRGLELNEQLLSANKGNQVVNLLSSWLDAKEVDPETRNDVVACSKGSILHKPLTGVPIIQADDTLFSCLVHHKIIKCDTGAIHSSDKYGNAHPSFIIIMPDNSTFGEATSNTRATTLDDIKRHEVSHFLWSFLQSGEEFFRRSDEADDDMKEAFESFRNEMVAYIISKNKVQGLGSQSTVYTLPSQFLNPEGVLQSKIAYAADETQEFAGICVDIARGLGIDSQVFIYAVMSSRNFSHCKDQFARLVPIERMDNMSIDAIYATWNENNSKFTETIREFLTHKGISISSKNIEDYFIYRIENKTSIRIFRDIFSEFEKVKRFAGAMEQGVPDEGILMNSIVMSKFSSFPTPLIEDIMKLPKEYIGDFPITGQPQDLAIALLSFRVIGNTFAQKTLSSVLTHYPEIHDILSAMENEVIERESTLYRDEYKDAPREERIAIESEIQKKAELIRSLIGNKNEK
ncbi:MAG: hypothetical protein Q8K26_04925 [Candidatus Gracilibacteria bacterium]|nr:hypothetical protein [Candidatus Gracilibacteria bacterium]